MRHAACKGCDTDVFFTPSREAEALAICSGCEVRAECLAFALSLPEQIDAAGVFGGLTVAQRRALRGDE